jgi:hypothetical protein
LPHAKLLNCLKENEMAKYKVLITAVAYIEVEADDPEHAELVASKNYDALDMEWSFVCDECDLIEEN